MTGQEYLRAGADLIEQYRRSVRADLEAIPEARIWDRPIPGQVSPANLVLHLSGNLNHFFGHLLGGSGYVRQRDREFEETGHLTRNEVLDVFEGACDEAKRTLATLDATALTEPAPLDKYPGDAPNHQLILRLLTHLTYHAGQIRSMGRLLAPPEC